MLRTCYCHGLHTCCWERVTIMACTCAVGNFLLPWPAWFWEIVTIVACTRAVGKLLLSWTAHVPLGSCYYRGLYTCCWEVVTIVECTRAVEKLLLSWPAHVLFGTYYYRGLHTCRWEVVIFVACTRAVWNLLLSWLAPVLLRNLFHHWISPEGRNIFQKFKAGFRLFVNHEGWFCVSKRKVLSWSGYVNFRHTVLQVHAVKWLWL